MARYYCNYESGNIGIPDCKWHGEYYLIAEVTSLLRDVLDSEINKICEFDAWE